jgi:hypothetical protein
MSKRGFSINRYNGYSIRNHYFTPNPTGRGCYLYTDDPDVIALIENADGYGVFIHPMETTEEIAAMKKADAEEAELGLPPEPDDEEPQPPIATQGARSSMSGGKANRRGQVIGKGKL